jgi:hypothetical protein
MVLESKLEDRRNAECILALYSLLSRIWQTLWDQLEGSV